MKRYLQSKLPIELVETTIEEAERSFEVPFSRTEGGTVHEHIPLAIRGTEGDHKLFPEDLNEDGAAWTAA